MRRKILLLAACILTFAVLLAVTSCGHTHTDENSDCVCDTCSEKIGHKDENNDSKCDVCATVYDSYVPSGEDEGDTTYTVNFVDFFGNEPEGVVGVDIYKGQEFILKSRMRNGTVSFTVPKGNYRFVLDMPYGDFAYDDAQAYFNPDRTDVTMVLYNALGANNAQQNINVPCSDHTDADEDESCDTCAANLPAISAGRYQQSAKAILLGASKVMIEDGFTYAVFTPAETGVYKFYLADGTTGVTLGNYGSPNFVLESNVAEYEDDGAFGFIAYDGSVSDIGGTTQIVIGVSSDTVSEAIVIIERVADAPQLIPYEDVYISEDVEKFDDLLNNTLVDIDITDSKLKVVYNEDDGYYHYGTASGPVVLIKITSGGNSNLTDFEFPSFSVVCETDRLCKIFYDDAGNITRKLSYNTLIDGYKKVEGSRGVVPLDAALAEMVKNCGDYMGWWSSNSIFGTNLIIKDNAWLFACCYYEENTNGTQGAPITVTPTEVVKDGDKVIQPPELAIKVDADEPIYFQVSSKAILTFNEAENLTVIIDGDTYTSDSHGKIKIENVPSNTIIQILSSSDTTARFTAEASIA